ncbi:hypothetical protein COCOBI_01-4880 [Coccomyxa sp. Obi]|nr:hypothetical protein COCOBI_01-4880 [Coccomyxa sp. Obi]
MHAMVEDKAWGRKGAPVATRAMVEGAQDVQASEDQTTRVEQENNYSQAEIQQVDVMNDEAQDDHIPFMQQIFLDTLSELNTSIEQIFLDPSAQAEQDFEVLQREADDAEREARQTLQIAEEHLIHLACAVQRFQEQIAQVLPYVSHKQGNNHMNSQQQNWN